MAYSLGSPTVADGQVPVPVAVGALVLLLLPVSPPLDGIWLPTPAVGAAWAWTLANLLGIVWDRRDCASQADKDRTCWT